MTGLSEDEQEMLIYRNGAIESLDELIAPDWDTSIVGGINSQGQILATGTYDGSTTTSQLLLTPVPEPAPICAFGFGALAILVRRLKRGRD